ncbi:MAG: DUF2058 domain-containing protein [Gammaproteobacteria bacterium]|nr:DUF2058 domain-containing protein [Gammaproteobacteria bacterium]
MGNSLFDQLKKSGLADKSQAHKARTEKHRQIKQQHKQKPKPNETGQAIEQTRLEKIERDRQLNAERKAEADSKALTAQIKQIIETHRQSKGVDHNSDEGIVYNFVENNKVKSILVSKTVQQQLSRGQLAIVKFNESYELLPNVVADRICARDEGWFIARNETVEVEGEDDPYKDYKIPDDLMW